MSPLEQTVALACWATLVWIASRWLLRYRAHMDRNTPTEDA